VHAVSCKYAMVHVLGEPCLLCERDTLRAELARVTADAEARIASREREMVRLTEKLRATTEEGDDTIRGLLELNDAANLRAESAERELAEARARVAELEKALGRVRDEADDNRIAAIADDALVPRAVG
jgi:chromosome segregation ATPase